MIDTRVTFATQIFPLKGIEFSKESISQLRINFLGLIVHRMLHHLKF